MTIYICGAIACSDTRVCSIELGSIKCIYFCFPSGCHILQLTHSWTMAILFTPSASSLFAICSNFRDSARQVTALPIASQQDSNKIRSVDAGLCIHAERRLAQLSGSLLVPVMKHCLSQLNKSQLQESI